MTRFVSVNIFWKNNVLVCLRGKMDRNYKKVYAVGGKVEAGETPEEAAVRETFEEAGVVIQESDLRVFENDIKIGMIHYTVVFNEMPLVRGPKEDCKDEIYDTWNIAGVPTMMLNGVNTRWAFINVHKLNNFMRNPKNRSFASKTFCEIYEASFNLQKGNFLPYP